MFTRQAVFILLTLALLAAQVAAADDYGAPGLRVFCENLLKFSANGTVNTTTPANETQVPPVQVNATLGAKHNDTLAKLGDANASISRMLHAGVPTTQAIDLLDVAWQWFDGQTAVELTGGSPDYSFSLQKVSEIEALESSSLAVNDDLKALASRIGSADSDANLTATKALVAQATQEFRDGRIDEAKALISKAYDEVSSAEADAVHSRTLVESARKNIESFLAENWQAILAVAAAVVILSFLFQKQIRRFLANARLKALMHEREVIESMLKSLQKDYFEKKNVTELTYHVKTKKYGDIIRNINRQLPLVKEELKRI